jgi:regulator of sigma E protease
MFAQPPLWFIAIAFLCALGPLVFIHELGHYLVGRWFGIGAESFSIGFGREIAGWTDKRGTRWKIGWLPLGGYVRFVGDMNPASLGASDQGLSPVERASAFHNKSWWKRFLVVLAGPAANFLLAILILSAFFMIFRIASTPPVAAGIVDNSAAESIGLRPGDRIVELAGQGVGTFEDILGIVLIRPNADVNLKYERAGQVHEARVRIGSQMRSDKFGQSVEVGLLGLERPEPQYRTLGPAAAVAAGTRVTFQTTRMIVVVVRQIVTGERSAKELGGPLRMAQVAGQQASLGPADFFWLLAMFSINLGFINLLPIPMLDGGHLVFYAAEAVSRRPVSERAQEWAFRGGLALLLALILFTTVNDLASFGLFERLGRLIG